MKKNIYHNINKSELVSFEKKKIFKILERKRRYFNKGLDILKLVKFIKKENFEKFLILSKVLFNNKINLIENLNFENKSIKLYLIKGVSKKSEEFLKSKNISYFYLKKDKIENDLFNNLKILK